MCICLFVFNMVCVCVSVRVCVFSAWSMFLISKARCKGEMSVRASGEIDNIK